ncbi:MAG: acyl-CoA dehydrogenase family protein [Candidatus Binatia bacterium]|nr:acyl-CoA dehydrogenase family protein [Candidatus Binatia bacterium]
MDFEPLERVEQTRCEFRRWLMAHQSACAEWRGLRHSQDMGARVEFLRAWQRALQQERWVAVHFPEEVGGRGASLLEHLAVQQELARADGPPLVNGAAVSIFAPTLLVFGTPAQRQRYLPPLLSAEELWCLGFSEPNAGSDLASLRTRAEQRGDVFVVNGQKVWTTYAKQADYGLFLVRTGPQAAPHKGISCLILPMRSAGVTVRPLREITGDSDFNEVFLENVQVPVTNLVGELHNGWQVILTALGHERGTLLLVDHVRRQVELEELRRWLQSSGRAGDPLVRQRFAEFWTEVAIMGFHGLALVSDLQHGRTPTDVSLLKLYGSELAQRFLDFALTAQGPYAQLWRGDERVLRDGAWQHAWLMARAMTIASGTSEIQRNIIAQRLLGLPRG